MKIRVLTAAFTLMLVLGSAFPTAASTSNPTAEEPVVPYLDALASPAVAGHPVRVEDNYTILADTLFHEAPDDWGGAYVDDDTLVVRTVRYTVDEATELLAELGVTDALRVVSSGVSIAELKRVASDIVESGIAGVISAGPQYASSSVVVGVDRDDLTQRAALFKIGGNRVITYRTTAPTTTSSRYWDLSPFHGGAQIVLTGTPGLLT